MESLALGGEALTAEQLRDRGVDRSALKNAAIGCLLAANALPTTGTTLEWHQAARDLAHAHAVALCTRLNLPAPKEPPKPQQRKGHGLPIARFLPNAGEVPIGLSGVPVLSVHGVKGETHDVTIFVVPPTKGGVAKCPSALWWPGESADNEERRIAYVAVTRSSGDLIVCVDETAYERLTTTRPAFVADFECLTVAEALGRIKELRVDQSLPVAAAAAAN
jgi:hypothetical protein